MTLPSQSTAPRSYAWLPALIIGIIVFALAIGLIALRLLEARLLASTGEALALAASDIAEKLDLLLYERYGDIQIMARTATGLMRNRPALSHELLVFQQVYPVYSWLAVADAKGRILASTDPLSVGQDRSGSAWFRAARERGGVQIHDAQGWEETGSVKAIAFSAPIMSPAGAFLGVVTSRVGIPVLAEYFTQTVEALLSQRATRGTIEWHFLTGNGTLIVDSRLRQENRNLNLQEMGLPSASMRDAPSGYVAEEHLRRRVPVLTGYARTSGYREFTGFGWRVLVRMDQRDILEPIRTVLWKLGTLGALIFIPLLGLLLWSTRRLAATNRSLVAEVAERTETEERFRQVVESAPYGMILVNQAGSIQLVNAQAEQLFGYTRDELLGQSIEILVPEASRTQHVTDRLSFQASPRTRSMGAGRALHGRCKDGRVFPVEIALVPCSLHGEPVALASVVDVSARKQAEEALQAAQEQLLEQQRRERERVEAELGKAREALVRQTKLAAIGQLAASIAHDLRNPLGAIRNASHLLKHRIPAEDRKGAEYLRVVDEEVATSDRIISNLLEIAHGHHPRKALVSLASVVEKAFRQARPASTIRWRLTCDPSPFVIWGDPTQLQQVFCNLIVNAAQAMGPDGEIHITARHAGGDDEILVADSGPGIPPPQRAQIFEPLFTTKADGTGLGLTICRQFVERHGGSIELIENGHPGATFAIRLPRHQEADGRTQMSHHQVVNSP